MAKRKRLIPLPDASVLGSVMAENAASDPVEGKVLLRAGFGQGAAPPIARVAGDAATQAALSEVTEAMERARAEGRLVQVLDLDVVETSHLVRDRIALDEEELGHLAASIREHGQRTPIEVADLGGGRFGLISGWRRIQALTRLRDAGGGAKFGSVLALLRRPSAASEAYVAMVEENEIRQGLSYYERARIAGKAVDLGVFETEKQALQRLFSAASRARRSKIGSFLTLFRALDDVLRFPAAIPERLGLALAMRLQDNPAEAARLCALLRANSATTAEAELAVLTALVSARIGSDKAEKTSAAPLRPRRQEVMPGVFLDVAGGADRPVVTLSGPKVDPAFLDRLERWIRAS